MSGARARAEQVRTLFRQSSAVLVANCVNSLIVSAALWNAVPRGQVVLWSASMGLMALARAAVARRYHRSAPSVAEAPAWGTRFVAGSLVAGLAWGVAGLAIARASGPLSELVLIFMVAGMCTAAAGTLAAYFVAFTAFVVPALAGLSMGLALLGDSLHQLMAGVVVLYGAGLSAVARVNHRALNEAFVLRFENAELVASLSVSQQRLEENNKNLEQRVAERTEELQKQAEALRDARRLEAVGRLAGGVAHDFNNLLTIILANISELVARRTLDARVQSALLEMRDACNKGAELVRQLLTLGRRQRQHSETLDLNQVLSKLERLIGRLLGAQLRLDLVLEAAPAFVSSDPTQIEQVIINLITNARDAMSSGGVVTLETRSIELLAEVDGIARGKYVVLSVTDTGAGMDAETRQRIFEPFFTTKAVGQGTGLGLATAHGIVEQSGGYIRVVSALARGSCFRVYLPAVAAPAARRSSHPEATRGSGLHAVGKRSRGATVLLVEDEPTVRSVTARILSGAGYRVLSARSGEQGLSLAAEHTGSIDLLLTDVVMAGFDGLELATRLKALRPDLRTLFMSGYSRHHAVPRDETSAGVGFLAKPFTYDALLTKVAELLSSERRSVAAPVPALRRI